MIKPIIWIVVILKNIKKSVYLKLNRIRLSFKIRVVKSLPRIYIHEKQKSKVRAVKCIVSLSALVISLFALPLVYSFILALIIFFLGTLLERVFFIYTALYVHLMPDFEIDNDLWIGVSFGYYEIPGHQEHIPLVGLVFSSAEYGIKFFSLLKKWNYDSLTDKEDNFALSFIINNEKSEYFAYIYPTMERKSAKEFFKRAERRRHDKSPDAYSVRLSAFVFTMKKFIITEHSYFPMFIRRYTDGVPFRLEAFVGTEQQAKEIPSVQGFTKFNLKIKYRRDLTREDWEYDLLRVFGD